MRFRALRRALIALASFAWMPVAPALADQLNAEQYDNETGYVAVEELSYETIIDASDGYTADLRLRFALHNSSVNTRDAVHTVALPFAAQITGLSVARGGQWQPGKATQRVHEPGRREPGTVFVRELPPESAFDIPGAEIVVFGLEPGATIQVEVRASVYPQLRGDRWELDLPARGHEVLALARDRRVLVKGLQAGEQFWVDDQGSGGDPFVLTQPEDTVTVAWPARIRSKSTVDGHLEVLPGPPGFDDGEFRLYLRLGGTSAAKPEHVVAVIDQSLSTPVRLQRDALRVFDGLFDALPEDTTFDAVGFSRRAAALLPSDEYRTGKGDDRAAFRQAVESAPRGQGTDLAAALVEAARRSQGRGRALIVIVTDGMFPAHESIDEVRSAYKKALRRGAPEPEVLFIVDDPMLTRSGLDPNHPVARIAGAIGARISLKSLAQVAPDEAEQLLSAPRVLADLEVSLPSSMILDDQVPAGLVAGTFVLLRGHFIGKPGSKAKVAGKMGGRRIARTFKATTRPRRAEALAAVTQSELDVAVSEGFAHPPWYRPGQARAARRGVTQAGRTTDERRGFLDRKIFRHYLTTRVLPRARVCYNRALTRNIAQGGRIVLEMEVGKGEVMLARTIENKFAEPDPKLVECMTEAAWGLDIPAGKLDDQIYRLRYPLQLIPPKEGQAARVERLTDEVLEVLLGRTKPEPPPLPADILGD